MKALLILSAATIFMCSSCKKSSSAPVSYMNSASITGPNLTMPACGGNYIISIFKGTDTIYNQFDSLPASSGINLATATFPISVKINWHMVKGGCDSLVSVDAIEKVD